jgi:hypothetical protein
MLSLQSLEEFLLPLLQDGYQSISALQLFGNEEHFLHSFQGFKEECLRLLPSGHLLLVEKSRVETALSTRLL